MKFFLTSFIAGALAAALFYAVAAGGLGFIFMMLPGLPIFYVGFAAGAQAMVIASVTATMLIGMIAALPGAAFFAIFSAAPAFMIVRRAILCKRSEAGAQQWFPLGLAFVELSVLLVAFAVSLCFYYASLGGIDALVQRSVSENMQEIDPNMQQLLLNLSSSLTLVVISASLWIWLLLVYVNGWLAHRFARTRGHALRPDFALAPFDMPQWMLGALTLSGITSIVGSETFSFAGKISLLLLLFPYFFSGIALIHEKAAQWPSKGIILFVIYFFLLAQAWPALLIAGFGVWHQLKNLYVTNSFINKP